MFHVYWRGYIFQLRICLYYPQCPNQHHYPKTYKVPDILMWDPTYHTYLYLKLRDALYYKRAEVL